MTIDWPHFTWASALLGGLLIGLASAALILYSHKIAGISGILGEALRLHSSDRAWRIAFIAGLLLAPSLYYVFNALPAIHIDTPVPLLVLSGLLVGFGTRLGSGCTSGHGVCGLAQNSPRSWAAVLTFMLVAAATVYLMRHVLGGAV
ncbi:YeeE/YedE family protein [Pseudomonas sp. 5P_3.1_Bac2]|uniref:YeeE/YedE family protein n=1 Tax=Pseudomonas sp. 5P_3.1_Bac2 TaxID=2971617 RepID=UPI0021C645D8|nr:YeeE/YedE thiosulfate transporter family protein [Pseudomonas sp. 5P_3.1_Bac2]MCU1719505.1 YeeE/YedE thiosulfate transporter family protein [Pseudomonas sp. 5P_3.1_Bac2]